MQMMLPSGLIESLSPKKGIEELAQSTYYLSRYNAQHRCCIAEMVPQMLKNARLHVLEPC